MGTPLGQFVRARRDALEPGRVGIEVTGRRRAPGLRRSELAGRAGISIEYLTRIEQGHDRNPTPSVVNALADALLLTSGQRRHLVHLAKITSGVCAGHRIPEPPDRAVSPATREILEMLDPGVAVVLNRLGDVLAWTPSFALVARGTGLLDDPLPNLVRFVFADDRSRAVFPAWASVADALAFDLWRGPSAAAVDWFLREVGPLAGRELARRHARPVDPPRTRLDLVHPEVGPLRWRVQELEVVDSEAQIVLVLLPHGAATAASVGRLLEPVSTPDLRAV